MATGHVLSTLEGHGEPIYSVCITSDGTKIVSGSLDKAVKVQFLQR